MLLLPAHEVCHGQEKLEFIQSQLSSIISICTGVSSIALRYAPNTFTKGVTPDTAINDSVNLLHTLPAVRRLSGWIEHVFLQRKADADYPEPNVRRVPLFQSLTHLELTAETSRLDSRWSWRFLLGLPNLTHFSLEFYGLCDVLQRRLGGAIQYPLQNFLDTNIMPHLPASVGVFMFLLPPFLAVYRPHVLIQLGMEEEWILKTCDVRLVFRVKGIEKNPNLIQRKLQRMCVHDTVHEQHGVWGYNRGVNIWDEAERFQAKRLAHRGESFISARKYGD